MIGDRLAAMFQHLVAGPGEQSRALSTSSSTEKPGMMPASTGKRCSSRSQKAWMVCTFRPPGVSRARVNRRRALSSSSFLKVHVADVAVNFGDQLFAVHCHPPGQRLEQPLGHFSGSSAGIGEAKDAFGLDASPASAG